jgi:hypothetical protein
MKPLVRRLCVSLLLASLAACQTTSGVQNASMGVQPGPDDGQVTAADLAAVPGDLAHNPIRLDGLTHRVVRAALGQPSFRRKDKGVEIWQYYGEGCILDLFIYEENGLRRVAHHQVRATGGESNACFRGIVDNRRRPQAS